MSLGEGGVERLLEGHADALVIGEAEGDVIGRQGDAVVVDLDRAFLEEDRERESDRRCTGVDWAITAGDHHGLAGRRLRDRPRRAGRCGG